MTASSTIDSSSRARGIHCQGCKQPLPLRMSGPAEIATLWECAACSAAFAGVLVPDLVDGNAHRVRLAQLHFDVEGTEPLLDEFRATVAQLNARPVNAEFIERRRSPREVRQIDAVAIGFGANYMLVGPTCRGIVANLSSHGMLLTTAAQLETPVVAVQMCGGGGEDPIARPDYSVGRSWQRLLRKWHRIYFPAGKSPCRRQSDSAPGSQSRAEC